MNRADLSGVWRLCSCHSFGLGWGAGSQHMIDRLVWDIYALNESGDSAELSVFERSGWVSSISTCVRHGLSSLGGGWLISDVTGIILYGDRLNVKMSQNCHRMFLGVAGRYILRQKLSVLSIMPIPFTVSFSQFQLPGHSLAPHAPSCELNARFTVTSFVSFPCVFPVFFFNWYLPEIGRTGPWQSTRPKTTIQSYRKSIVYFYDTNYKNDN